MKANPLNYSHDTSMIEVTHSETINAPQVNKAEDDFRFIAPRHQ